MICCLFNLTLNSFSEKTVHSVIIILEFYYIVDCFLPFPIHDLLPDDADAPAEYGSSIELNSASEFCRSLGEILTLFTALE